jgi:putative phosphoribosyl transferase
MHTFFANRRDAGRILATHLKEFANYSNLVVLALPRGGVPVAFEVAKALHLPLDVFTVRKLGLPDQPEIAIGAIASGGVCILNRQLIDAYKIPKTIVDQIIAQEKTELERRQVSYVFGKSLVHLQRENVILVDDGLATGATMSAAVFALRKSGCKHLVVAVPVSSPAICAALAKHVDKIVCAETPTKFGSVGQWYQDFSQTTDDEVKGLLETSAESFADEVAATGSTKTDCQ